MILLGSIEGPVAGSAEVILVDNDLEGEWSKSALDSLDKEQDKPIVSGNGRFTDENKDWLSSRIPRPRPSASELPGLTLPAVSRILMGIENPAVA